MKLLRFASLVTLGLLAFALPAKSAVINVNEVIDLDDWVANSYTLFGTNDYAISNGDTVNINYTFANGRAIQVTNSNAWTNYFNPAWPWLFSTNTSGTFNILNASTNLDGAIFTGGSGSTSYFEASHSSAAAHLGLYGSFSLDGLATVEFTGVSSSFTVDYVPAGGGIYRSWFTNWGSALPMEIVNSSASVPDNGSTLALFGLGLASLAFVRRKR